MIRKFLRDHRIAKSSVFTMGHVTIDTFIIALITGAPITVALATSMIGPALNAVWFWALDKFVNSGVKSGQ